MIIGASTFGGQTKQPVLPEPAFRVLGVAVGLAANEGAGANNYLITACSSRAYLAIQLASAHNVGGLSRYQVTHANGNLDISIMAINALCAPASCIAKYARESVRY